MSETINQSTCTQITDYELSERLRVDADIKERSEHLQKQILAERVVADNELIHYRESIRHKVETELSLEYTQKYKDEYTRKMSELGVYIDIERHARLQRCDTEINAYAEAKKREMRVWESKERCAIQQRLHEHELTQRKQQKTTLDEEYESGQKDIVALCETERQHLLESGKNEVALEISSFRTEELRKAKEEIDSMYEALSEKLQTDLIHFENTERLVMNQSSDAERDKITRSLIQFEADMRASITQRISVHEDIETQRILTERETVLNQKLDLIRQTKEVELLNLYQDKDVELNSSYLKKKTELDMSLKIFGDEKLASVTFDLELYKAKQLQAIETQHERDILQFRTKVADEYTKIQVAQKELNDRELEEMKQHHDTLVKNKQAEYEEALTRENEKQIQAFKTKLQDEFTRLRLVEKMILQSDMEKEYERLRAQLSPEYERLKDQAEQEFKTIKTQFADKLMSERLSMEEQQIVAHSAICASHQKSLDEEFAKQRTQMEKDLQKETQLRRGEMLETIHQELEAYKTIRLKDITQDVSTIRERELEEMRESLYVLAMERVKEKMSKV